MKSHRRLALRLAFGLCGLGGLAYLSAAHAQSESPPPAPPVYQDRVIGGGSLAPDISMGDGATSDTQGLAPSLQLDGVFSALSSRGGGSNSAVSENGIVAKAQWETVSYGDWSLDAAARTGGSEAGSAEQGQGGVITLQQRGMPFDGGWQADNALGDVNSPDINLARIQPRFYLPTSPMQGLSPEWHGPYGPQLVHGAGLETGAAIDNAALLSSSDAFLSAAWAAGGEHLQMNLLDGDSGGKANALGTWIDASMAQGRFLQNAGIFRIDPNMSWGNQLISNDAQGGYYRLNYQSRQWLADLGIDEVRSVSGLGSDTTFLTGDTRYQVSRDWGTGGVANLSRTDGGTSWSLEGYVDHSNAAGTCRVQADFAETTVGQDP